MPCQNKTETDETLLSQSPRRPKFLTYTQTQPTTSVYLIRLLLSLGTQHPLTPSFLCSVQEWLSFVLLWMLSAPCPLSNFIAVLSKTFVWLHYLIYLLDMWLCGTGQLIIAEQSSGSIPKGPILISGSTAQVERQQTFMTRQHFPLS